MARRFRQKQNHDGGSMLATLIIIVLGAVMCSWVVLISGSALQDWVITGIVIGTVVLVVGLLLYRYGRTEGGSLAFWNGAFTNHYDDGLAGSYRPEKVKNSANTSETTSNEPVSAAELRDIRETSANTWVPAKTSKKRKQRD